MPACFSLILRIMSKTHLIAPYSCTEDFFMGRPRKIWKRAENGYYYTKIDGVQTRLEKTMPASQTKLERILKGEQSGPVGKGMSFARLADKFLDHSQAENEQETYEVHRFFLQSFKDFVGK